MRGDLLKKLREERGISRHKLAELAYVTEAIVQSWEEGWFIQAPSSGEIESMAECFGMDETELMELLDLEDDDLSDDQELSWIDIIDAGVRARQFIRKQRK